MTLADALALQVDQWICSRDDATSYRITEAPWHNADDTDVRVFLAGYHGGTWVSPLGFERDPGLTGRTATKQTPSKGMRA